MQSFIRFARVVTYTNRFYFATETPKKIPNNWEIPKEAQIEMANALFGAYSCRMFAELFKENFQYVSDYQIAFAMQRINEMDLELDDHFYNTMVPILKDYVSRFTKEHNTSLGQIIANCGYLNVQDDKLWQIYEDKIIKERLYRYIPLDNLVEMIHGVSQSSYGSPELFSTIEQVLIRHRLALTDNHRQLCLQAYKKKDYQSPLLYKLLANPKLDMEEELRSHQKKLDV